MDNGEKNVGVWGKIIIIYKKKVYRGDKRDGRE